MNSPLKPEANLRRKSIIVRHNQFLLSAYPHHIFVSIKSRTAINKQSTKIYHAPLRTHIKKIYNESFLL